MDVQGGNARIDQTLALPAVGISGAGDAGQFAGFFLESAHASA
jgi:hypothetical protein